jgi:uncharacterized small protein (DUF1192 family)
MSTLWLSELLVWAQASAPNLPGGAPSRQWLTALTWFYVLSDPRSTSDTLTGGIITWCKVLSLICLVCWIGYWIVIGLQQGVVGRGRWYDFAGVAALVLTPLTVALRTMESLKRLPGYTIHLGPAGSIGLSALAVLVCAFLYVFWADLALARTIRRHGRALDMAVLLGVHVALGVGLAVGVALQRAGLLNVFMLLPASVKLTTREGLIYGVRIGATYMGYIVLARVALLLLYELVALRGRRLYAIARLSIYEANRRMWAPWVVITVFLLVLAFLHWFLQPPRAAEMGRQYVATLSLVCSMLLTVMVTILTPLSLPTDIQQQTIYTVVSKPVRRLELIWGRMIGYMALVTVLMVLFGFASLGYLWRTVRTEITKTEDAAVKAKTEGRMSDFKLLAEQADQLRTRMRARVPIKGSLSFLDAKGQPHAVGIDVGVDQSLRQPRSHIEGATSSRAIWSYGIVPDPFTRPGHVPILLNRRIPVDDFLTPGTMEWYLDRANNLDVQIKAATRSKDQPDLPVTKVREIDAAIARNQAELERAKAQYQAVTDRFKELLGQAETAKAAGDEKRAEALQADAAKLASPPITVEMTFNVYRTTKGRVGEPVYAEIKAINPRTLQEFEGDVFPVKEYYTNRVQLPPWILAGSGGALRIEILCINGTQYLGMAESDLYLLAREGNFGFNYMKGLFGVWLQAMVLTAIGVFAGSFLSWPVALLTTIAVFIAGQLAFEFLVDFSRQALLGGGPFESLIRIVTHDNQMSELAPTAGVVLAKTLDSLVMPVMSLLVYIVPNFQKLDVTNTVADGFMVSWETILVNSLLALAYALPFSFAGYLILKNREVAA